MQPLLCLSFFTEDLSRYSLSSSPAPLFRYKLRRANVRYLLGLQHLTHSAAAAAVCVFFFFLRKFSIQATEDPGLHPLPLFLFTALPPPFSSPSLLPLPLMLGLSVCCHGDSHMGVLFLFVLQVQTLYYSPDHKLVDGGLVIEGHSEVFGGEEDHLQFVQVLNSLCLTSLSWSLYYILLGGV